MILRRLILFFLILNPAYSRELWKSLSPMGGGSSSQTLLILEDYLNLFDSFVFKHQQDEKTKLLFNKIMAHTMEFDSKKIYRLLETDTFGGRHLYGNGIYKTPGYFFSIDQKAREEIKNTHFGSSQLVYEALKRADSIDTIYDMFIGYNFFLKKVHYKNYYQSLFGLKDYIRGSLPQLEKQIDASLPKLKEVFDRHAKLQLHTNSDRSIINTKINMKVDMHQIKKYQYGHIYNYLYNLSNIFQGTVKVYDEKEKLYAVFKTDSLNKEVEMEISMGDNFSFYPLKKANKEDGVNFIDKGTKKFKLVLEGVLSLLEIDFNIKKYEIPILYQYTDQMSSAYFEFSQIPSFNIKGNKFTSPLVSLLKGVFSIEQKVTHFFEVLKSGKKGPSYLTVTYFNENELTPESLYFKSNLSVLDNFLLKLGFKMVSKRIIPNDREMDEILLLTKDFQDAFQTDLIQAKREFSAI